MCVEREMDAIGLSKDIEVRTLIENVRTCILCT